MSLERRLRGYLSANASDLPEPQNTLDSVMRRGRRRRIARATGTAVFGIAAAAALTFGLLERAGTRVEFDPAAPPSSTPEQMTPDTETAEPQAPRREASADSPPIALSDLPAPVLAYGPGRNGQVEVVSGSTSVLWPEPVAAAMPDGDGGAVVLNAAENRLLWLPRGEAEPVRLAETSSSFLLQLRAVLADGRVLYSEVAKTLASDSDTERFFAILRSPNARPELLFEEPIYETTFLGPISAGAERMVSGSCHLQCMLWEGLAVSEPEPVYRGDEIAGLTTTPDGDIIGFYESDIVSRDVSPQLVLLDGGSFRELARVDLPVADQSPGRVAVSLSSDGQNVLVAAGRPRDRLPTTTYLVTDARSSEPSISLIDYDGVVSWMDASAAAGRARGTGK